MDRNRLSNFDAESIKRGVGSIMTTGSKLVIGIGIILVVSGAYFGIEISIIGTGISIIGFFYGIYSDRKQSTDIKEIREQNEEIIKTLKEREELAEELKEKEAVIRRFRSSIRSEGISTKRLVEEYTEKELNALVLYKGFEKPGEIIKDRPIFNKIAFF